MDGQELKALREAHNLTQVAIGELLGYTGNYISRLEREDERITKRFEKLVRLLTKQRPSKKYSEIT